jgi:hypothetical protein
VKNASGKLVIIAILSVALIAAGTSWWFRYTATSRAVRFWGPQAARLIRDAPVVELREYGSQPDADFMRLTNRRDISHAPGLVHLRNALLEDRSFKWPAEFAMPGRWQWAIVFRDESANAATVYFTGDWEQVGSADHERTLSCQPISSGLAKFVEELPPEPAAAAR